MTFLEKIKRLEELEKKATPGPWHIGWMSPNSDAVDIDAPTGEQVAIVHHRENQAFVCQSRNTLPSLLQFVSDVEEVVRLWRMSVDEQEGCIGTEVRLAIEALESRWMK
jgi:hypothetical protein